MPKSVYSELLTRPSFLFYYFFYKTLMFLNLIIFSYYYFLHIVISNMLSSTSFTVFFIRCYYFSYFIILYTLLFLINHYFSPKSTLKYHLYLKAYVLKNIFMFYISSKSIKQTFTCYYFSYIVIFMHHYLSRVIISHMSLFLIRYYFLCVIISSQMF